jgi:hypothetical protein
MEAAKLEFKQKRMRRVVDRIDRWMDAIEHSSGGNVGCRGMVDQVWNSAFLYPGRG